MKFFKFSIILTLSLLLNDCTTPYQPRGFLGGYSDSRIDSNTVRVSFYGNGHTSQEKVENSMLYRCAEVTLQDGYDYFTIASGGTTPSYSSYTTPGTYNQFTQYGYGTASTFGTYEPGETIITKRFESSVLIKMFNGIKPSNSPNTYDAHELIHYMKPQITSQNAGQ